MKGERHNSFHNTKKLHIPLTLMSPLMPLGGGSSTSVQHSPQKKTTHLPLSKQAPHSSHLDVIVDAAGEDLLCCVVEGHCRHLIHRLECVDYSLLSRVPHLKPTTCPHLKPTCPHLKPTCLHLKPTCPHLKPTCPHLKPTSKTHMSTSKTYMSTSKTHNMPTSKTYIFCNNLSTREPVTGSACSSQHSDQL